MNCPYCKKPIVGYVEIGSVEYSRVSKAARIAADQCLTVTGWASHKMRGAHNLSADRRSRNGQPTVPYTAV